jgi:hypothetical protein
MKTAKFVKEITVIDPDSKGEVELSVYKHENGGMFAVDSSFLDQVARTDDYDRPIISDPFNDTEDEAIEEVLLFDDNSPDALDTFIENADLPQE